MGAKGKLQRYVPEAVAGGLCHRRLLNIDRRRCRLTSGWDFSNAASPGDMPDFGVALLILDASVEQLAEALGLSLGARLHCAFRGAVPKLGETGLWTETAVRPLGDQWVIEAVLRDPLAPDGPALEGSFLFERAEAGA
jgi:hypothetical protein